MKTFLLSAMILFPNYGLAATECVDAATQAGGDLHGVTSMKICHDGNLIETIVAKHNNYGEHDHKGYLRIADNRNWGVSGNVTTVHPDKRATKSIGLDKTVSKGWRVCAVWVKSPSNTYTNHACVVFDGDELDED